MGKTSIEWTSFTWNPIRARSKHTKKAGWYCEKVSPGCAGCYAESLNRWVGTGLPYNRAVSRGNLDIFLDEKVLTQPLRWKQPRRIFVCSMTDLFGEFVTDEMIDRVLAVMMLSPRHTFQVLTKRAQRMRDYFAAPDLYRRILRVADHELRPARPQLAGIGISNPADAAFRRWIWLGVSVEDQATADERIPLLLQTPAVVRWVSYEPALGPVDFTRIPMDGGAPAESDRYLGTARGLYLNPLRDTPGSHDALDWIVVGGESGPGARPFDLEWARAVLRQCAGTPTRVFIKQLGARPSVACVCGWPDSCRCTVSLKNKKGGDPDEWPADLRVREMPGGAR